MKKVLILFILSFTFLFHGISQDKDVIIKNIREKFKEINDYKNYKKISFDNEEFMEHMTDGGGELNVYIKNDSVYKIYEWIGLSFGVRKVEYYYSREKLIFAYQTEEVFNHIFHIADTVEIEMSMDEAYRLIKTCELRYYFDNDSIVEYLVKGEQFGGGYNKEENIADILKSSKDYIDFIKTKQ